MICGEKWDVFGRRGRGLADWFSHQPNSRRGDLSLGRIEGLEGQGSLGGTGPMVNGVIPKMVGQGDKGWALSSRDCCRRVRTRRGGGVLKGQGVPEGDPGLVTKEEDAEESGSVEVARKADPPQVGGGGCRT